jgi:hypothetical protein
MFLNRLPTAFSALFAWRSMQMAYKMRARKCKVNFLKLQHLSLVWACQSV